jgi:hypothetical protein
MTLLVFQFLMSIWLFPLSHPNEEKEPILDTFFLTNEYNITSKRENAAYVRILKNYDEKENRYDVTDYTIDGIKQFSGGVRFLNWGVLNGKYNTFYPNGSVHSTGDCITFDDFFLDNHKNFYRNGQLRSESRIGSVETTILQAFDSLGNQTLIFRDGLIELEENGVLWQGKVVREKKDSVWIGVDEYTKEILFQETFSMGNLIKGIAYVNGEKIKYEHLNIIVNQNAHQNLQIKLTKFLKKKLPHSKEDRHYIELIFKKGKAYCYKYLIKKLGQPVPDLSDFALPVKWLYLNRGTPVEQTSYLMIITF